jgi:hypothetical protein
MVKFHLLICDSKIERAPCCIIRFFSSLNSLTAVRLRSFTLPTLCLIMLLSEKCLLRDKSQSEIRDSLLLKILKLPADNWVDYLVLCLLICENSESYLLRLDNFRSCGFIAGLVENFLDWLNIRVTGWLSFLFLPYANILILFLKEHCEEFYPVVFKAFWDRVSRKCILWTLNSWTER